RLRGIHQLTGYGKARFAGLGLDIYVDLERIRREEHLAALHSSGAGARHYRRLKTVENELGDDSRKSRLRFKSGISECRLHDANGVRGRLKIGFLRCGMLNLLPNRDCFFTAFAA